MDVTPPPIPFLEITSYRVDVGRTPGVDFLEHQVLSNEGSNIFWVY